VGTASDGGRIEGKVSLISGSASGIGEAVTRGSPARVRGLWINDINADRLDALVTELRGDGVEVHGTVGDMSDSTFVNRLGRCREREIRPHRHPLQQRGISRHALIGDTTDEDWHFQQRMTIDTVFYATRAVLPHMIREGKARS
jgi:NADP-dependent 3-hydroxy acid dehydrogenase YdfG